MFNHIHIIGLGLIGSSIARAVKQKKLSKKITGSSKKEGIEGALKLGIIDSEIKTENIKDADLIIIAAPLSAYPEIAAKIPKNEKAVITDIGSVKEYVIRQMKNSLSNTQFKNFVPAHPIAGSEKTGVYAGDATLFNKKKLIITQGEETSKTAILKVKKFWEEIGSSVLVLDAKEHDAIYAKISHLPQLLAFIFDKTIKTTKTEFYAKSALMRDFLRLTNSDAHLWAEIFLLNSDALLKGIAAFEKELIKNLELAENKDEEDFIEKQVATLISFSAKNIATKKEIKFSGSGFRDFTKIAPAKTALIKSKKTEKFIFEFLKNLKLFAEDIKI